MDAALGRYRSFSAETRDKERVGEKHVLALCQPIANEADVAKVVATSLKAEPYLKTIKLASFYRRLRPNLSWLNSKLRLELLCHQCVAESKRFIFAKDVADPVCVSSSTTSWRRRYEHDFIDDLGMSYDIFLWSKLVVPVGKRLPLTFGYDSPTG